MALVEPGEPVDGERLIEDADAAMYRAKERGGARTELFDAAMRDRAVEALAIEQELQRALENGELRLFYQPAVDLSSGTLVGAEALVRWEHPERGLLDPGQVPARGRGDRPDRADGGLGGGGGLPAPRRLARATRGRRRCGCRSTWARAS